MQIIFNVDFKNNNENPQIKSDLTADKIIEIISDYFSIEPKIIINSENRTDETYQCKQFICLFLQEYLKLSSTEIAKLLSYSTVSSVTEAIRKLKLELGRTYINLAYSNQYQRRYRNIKKFLTMSDLII